MRICVLEEVAAVKDLLCSALELHHHQPITYQTTSMCLECLSIESCCKGKFEVLIIGDHPQTTFLWRQVVEQVHRILPNLPILLISNTGYNETLSIEQQLPQIKVLDEPFHLNDFYRIIDELEM